MDDRAFVENCDIGGAPADVGQDYAFFPFGVCEHRFGCGDRLHDQA